MKRDYDGALVIKVDTKDLAPIAEALSEVKTLLDNLQRRIQALEALPGVQEALRAQEKAKP